MSTAAKVIEIVSEQLTVPVEEITLESKFADDLKADSLDIVDLVMKIEDEFSVEFPEEETEKFVTVGSVVDFIEKV